MSSGEALPRLDELGIAARAAREVMPGMVVNLGVGIPTAVSIFIEPEREVLLHSENGVLGFGPVILADPDRADLTCVNAGGQPVERAPGMSFLGQHESFELIRGGRIDVAFLGALEVSARGDLANYHKSGRVAGSIGGAQDLALGAKVLCVLMTHTDSRGRPKLVETATLPLTAVRCVRRIITDVAVIDVLEGGLLVREMLPGWTPAALQEITGAPLAFADGLAEMA